MRHGHRRKLMLKRTDKAPCACRGRQVYSRTLRQGHFSGRKAYAQHTKDVASRRHKKKELFSLDLRQGWKDVCEEVEERDINFDIHAGTDLVVASAHDLNAPGCQAEEVFEDNWEDVAVSETGSAEWEFVRDACIARQNGNLSAEWNLFLRRPSVRPGSTTMWEVPRQ